MDIYRSILTVSLLVVFNSIVVASYVPDINQERLENIEKDKTHLVPINATPPSQEYFIALYIARPSFKPPFGWMIYRKGKKYILVKWNYVHLNQIGRAKIKSMYDSLFERNSRNSKRASTQKPISLKTVGRKLEFPKALVSPVYSMWTNSLLQTRYTRNAFLSTDGVFYYFSTYLRGVGWLHGKTWSPTQNTGPRFLVEMGDYIYNLKQTDLDNVDRRRKIIKKLKSYEKKINQYYRTTE